MGWSRLIRAGTLWQVQLSSFELSNGASMDGADGKDSSGSDDEGNQGPTPDGSGSVAAVMETLTELVSLQTPASVWLPNKRLTVQATGKVRCRAAREFAAVCLTYLTWYEPFWVPGVGKGEPKAFECQENSTCSY